MGGDSGMGSNTITPAPVLNRNSSDDEILGLLTHTPRRTGRREANGDGRDSSAQDPRTQTNEQLSMNFDDDELRPGTRRVSATDTGTVSANTDATRQPEPEHLRAALDANPELRDAWQEANAYRETFATPEEARAATALVGDMNRMDALFFSRRPEDHAELARAVSKLDPEAFASLTRAMNALANDANRTRQQVQAPTQNQNQNPNQSQDENHNRSRDA